MTHNAMTHHEARRGVVLVIVLWSIALLSALAMAASVTFRGFAGVMVVDRSRVQSDALLTAGLEASASTIETLGDAPLREIEITVALSTGSVRAHLDDQGGRIDIGKAPLEVLTALLRSVGAPVATADGIARRVVELRGPGKVGDGGTRPGAEQPFTDVLQLGHIPGMRPDWLAAIAALTTVHGSETVNPLTAPRGVIAALPGVDGARLEAFLAQRRSSPADADRLARALGLAQQYLAAKPQQVAAIELTARLTDGYIAAARAVIVVLPQDSEPYRVLEFTPVPSHRLL
jgi:general secretion pathway protein K